MSSSSSSISSLSSSSASSDVLVAGFPISPVSFAIMEMAAVPTAAPAPAPLPSPLPASAPAPAPKSEPFVPDPRDLRPAAVQEESKRMCDEHEAMMKEGKARAAVLVGDAKAQLKKAKQELMLRSAQLKTFDETETDSEDDSEDDDESPTEEKKEVKAPTDEKKHKVRPSEPRLAWSQNMLGKLWRSLPYLPERMTDDCRDFLTRFMCAVTEAVVNTGEKFARSANRSTIATHHCAAAVAALFVNPAEYKAAYETRDVARRIATLRGTKVTDACLEVAPRIIDDFTERRKRLCEMGEMNTPIRKTHVKAVRHAKKEPVPAAAPAPAPAAAPAPMQA